MSENRSYTCTDYRKEMILIGLRRRLEDPGLSPDERDALEVEIRKAERFLEDGC